ncbi:ricin-type beta-trefoil lectin domain protein [Streptomyces sp. NBC_00696]|uniref:ricin-type beta-trefoil lectin domain protein n=1 Tax=Streptomyces sp. NBC_00696 TaxID=2903672 RepID=UPI002E307E8D|nr:ricin-type beta-trefoil lectin domain protein [Streptomyces sp. NBC_00696]
MKDAGPSNSPSSAHHFEVTDEQLSAELKKWTGTTPALQPVGELLDRHWEAAFAYARLCTDGPHHAGMLTTAAFTRLFGESLRQSGPTAAWRPQVLVTIRRIAAEWVADRRQDMLHPDLRSAAGEGDRAAARLLPVPERRLLSRAFQRLPQSARTLLWHIEVESEPFAIPAGLLGLDEEGADVELGRARGRLREECLQVHRELAQDDECQRYIRLLDVTFRRGGAEVDPDLAMHLSVCKHCRYTADQLNQFNAGLGIALAEAVLGWGARAYLEVRAGSRALPPEVPAASSELAVRPGPRRGELRSAHKAARRVRRRNLAVAVLTVSGLVVLPLVLWSIGGSGGGKTGTESKSAGAAGTGKESANPSWVGKNDTTQGTLSGRLHNVESGLCIGVVGNKPLQGAEAELQSCSSAAGQQWSYETDGQLRSTADPGLCLDSHLAFEVELAPCTGASSATAKNIRYDFTLQGILVPRWNQDLALTPASTAGGGALVLKTRADGSAQRWVFDTSKADPQMQVVNWDTDSTGSPTPTTKSAAPVPAKTPKATPTPTPTPTASTPQTTPTTAAPTLDYCDYYPSYCAGTGQDGGGWGGGGGGGNGGGGGHRGH